MIICQAHNKLTKKKNGYVVLWSLPHYHSRFQLLLIAQPKQILGCHLFQDQQLDCQKAGCPLTYTRNMRAKSNYHHRIQQTSLKIHNHILECALFMLPFFPFLKNFRPTLPRKNHHKKKLPFAIKNPRVESTSSFLGNIITMHRPKENISNGLG